MSSRIGNSTSEPGRGVIPGTARLTLVMVALAVGSPPRGVSAQTLQLRPVRSDGPFELVDDHIVISPGPTVVELEIRLAGWGSAQGMPTLGGYQAAMDGAGYASGTGAALKPLGWPDTPAAGAFIVQSICSQSGAPCALPSDCGPGEGACIARPDYVFAGLFPITIVSTQTLSYVFGGIVAGLCKDDEGAGYYGGTLLVQVPAGAEGTYTLGFASGESDTFFADCDGVKLPGLVTRSARLTVLSAEQCTIGGPSDPCQSDCNANGMCDLCELASGASDDCNANQVPDGCDIEAGTSRDCDFSGVPDECEADCNANGQHDLCDIATGHSSDCNGNGVPDDCEPDCQPNGIADQCDLTAGTSNDCDGNGIPDECEPDCQPNGVPDPCEVLDGTSDDCNANGIPDECDRDCQPNGVPDDCDLAAGESDDCNLNGVPDECDEDCDHNGVPDDCETVVAPTIRLRPVDADVVFARCGSGILIEPGGARVELELRLSGWGLAPGAPTLGTYQAVVDASQLAGAHAGNQANGTIPGVDLQPISGVHGLADGVYITLRTCASEIELVSTGQRCDPLDPPLPPCGPDEVCIANPAFVFSGTVQAVGVSPPNLAWGATAGSHCKVAEDLAEDYAGTLILDVPAEATGTYTFGFDEAVGATFLNNCGGVRIDGVVFVPGRIRIAECGDGVIELTEVCDDGNAESRDGCSAACAVEPTWSCAGEPSVCVTSCGDGVRGPDEQCDDGNRNHGDGCSAACEFEALCVVDILTAPAGATRDEFGTSVAIDGDHVISGAPGQDAAGTNAGAAYIHHRADGDWDLQDWLIGNGVAAGDQFGLSVALDNGRAVVGAPRHAGKGAAFVFRLMGDTWLQEAKLVASDASAGHEFGSSVALDGDLLVVGAVRDDQGCGGNPGCDAGAVYVFRFGGSNWSEEVKLAAAAAGDQFGASVAIRGEVIVVGAPRNDVAGANAGSAFVFEYNGVQWVQSTALTASDAEGGAEFGRSVAIDGDVALVGAWLDDNQGVNAGAAYVYRKGGGAWIEALKLIPTDASEQSNFGTSVTVRGGLALVSAAGKDDLCPSDPACNSGRAFLFRRTESAWMETATLIAPDAAAGDRFGWSVSLGEQRAVVGAPGTAVALNTNVGASFIFAVDVDCNENGAVDECDLQRGVSLDSNENEVPDECEFGACCQLDGTCVVVEEAGCTAGTWTGGQTCDPNPCPQPGACCGPEGFCGDMFEAECAWGTWTEGLSCVPNPCPQPGSCCDEVGICRTTFEADCPTGPWHEGLDCEPNPCPQPGACCAYNGSCRVYPEAECVTGNWTEGASCRPNPCPQPGRCCRADGSCDFVLPADCAAALWLFGGACEPNPCPQPGACCFADGTCEVTFSADCTGHAWAESQTCQPNACPQPGACCEFDGACRFVLEGECLNGVWEAAESCVPNTCPQPGACCAADGRCAEVLEGECGDGSWSEGDVCAPNRCPQPGACCQLDGICRFTLVADCVSGVWTEGASCEPNPCSQPPASPLPAPFPYDGARNRYISFDPRKAENDDRYVAFRVSLRSLTQGSCSGNGAPCRLDRGDADCGMCSLTRMPCIDAATDCSPPGQACLPSGEACVNDRSQSVGLEWWVGPTSPLGNDVHLLVSSPAFRRASDNWPAIVHVADCEIVPRAVYGVTAVDRDRGTESAPLEIATAGKPSEGYWADAVGTLAFFCGGSFLGPPCEPINSTCPMDQPCLRAWPPADGVVDFDDIIASVYAFEQQPDRPVPEVSWVDLHGADGSTAGVDPPDHIINFADVQFMVLAFEGSPYPFSDPADCPDVNAWP